MSKCQDTFSFNGEYVFQVIQVMITTQKMIQNMSMNMCMRHQTVMMMMVMDTVMMSMLSMMKKILGLERIKHMSRFVGRYF